MPARTFTKATIRYRDCANCNKPFPDSRRNRLYDTLSCKRQALRIRKRNEHIAKRGGKCETCGKPYDPGWPRAFFVLQSAEVICGECLSRRSRAKFRKSGRKAKSRYEKTSKLKKGDTPAT